METSFSPTYKARETFPVFILVVFLIETDEECFKSFNVVMAL